MNNHGGEIAGTLIGLFWVALGIGGIVVGLATGIVSLFVKG